MQVRRWVANEAKRARYIQTIILLISLLLEKLFKLETWNFGYNFTATVSNAIPKMTGERSETKWARYIQNYDFISVAIIESKLEGWNF